MEHWAQDMHEPIIVVLYFPSFEHKPWFVKGAPWSLKVQKDLHEKLKVSVDVPDELVAVLNQVDFLLSASADDVENILLLKNH